MTRFTYRFHSIVLASSFLAVIAGEGKDSSASPNTDSKTQQDTHDEANKLLAEVASTYANAQSYLDEGVVTATIVTEKEERTTLKPFSTAFSKLDGMFRYEFRSRKDDVSWDTYVIRAVGDRVEKWWSIKPQIEKQESLQIALGAAVGVSGGSASWIPQLLIPNSGPGRILLRLKDAVLLPEKSIDGVVCVGVTGTTVVGTPEIFWIEKDRKLIRRIEETMKPSDFTVKTLISYKPDINIEIPKEKFELNIPAKGGK